MNRLGAVLTSVTRKLNCDRSSAWSRTFSSGRPTAEATRSIVSGSSASDGSWTSAATRRPPRSIVVTARSRRRRRLLDVPAVRVDPALAVAEAVDDLERRVVQRVGDRVAERDAGIEREQDPRGAGAVEAAAQHAGEERERHERRTRSGRAPRRASTSGRSTWSSDDGDESAAPAEMPHGDVDGAQRPPAARPMPGASGRRGSPRSAPGRRRRRSSSTSVTASAADGCRRGRSRSTGSRRSRSPGSRRASADEEVAEHAGDAADGR